MFRVALLTLISVAAAEKYIGKLSTLQHDVSGDLYAEDDLTLIIKNFKYDGSGPDAFFWVGKSGTPASTNESTTLILAHPFEGYNYEYKDEDAPVLREYAGESVTLNLPKNFKVSEIKWFSVWCRKFSVDFGNLMFPADFMVDAEPELPHPLAPATVEPEPEPESEPGYDHDNHHDDHHDGAKPEPKPEPKPRPAGAATCTVTAAAIFFSLIAAKFF